MRPRAWDEGLGTGIASIDAEHRVQVGLVNALEEALRSGGDAAAASLTLQRLADLTAAHFHAEEHLMQRCAYPHLAAHVQEHVRLIGEVGHVRAGVEAGNPQQALAHVVGLRTWLTGHVKSMDQAFALWCARNGIDAETGGR